MRFASSAMGFSLISLRNLGRNFKRNLATGSAIAIGFAGIFLLSSYYNRAYFYLKTFTVFPSHTGHIVIYKHDGLDSFQFDKRNFSLSAENQTQIEIALKADSRIDFFEKQLWGAGLIGNGCSSVPMVVRGYDPQVDQRVMNHEQVRYWMPKFKPQSRGQALSNYPVDLPPIQLTEAIAHTIGKLKVHDDLPNGTLVPVNCQEPDAKSKYAQDANVQMMSGTWAGAMNALDGEVVAQFSTGFDQTDELTVLAPVNLVQKLFDTDNIARYSIWVKNDSDIKSIVRDLKRSLGDGVDVLSWDDSQLSPYFFGTTQFLFVLVLFLSIILGTVVGLSVLNSMTMTILERSSEIGTYRAIGFRTKHVRELFLLEALWLCLASLLIGLALGIGLTQFINGLHVIYHPPGISGGMELHLAPNLFTSIVIAVSLLALVLVCTFISARRRSMVSPVELLGGPLR